MNSSETTYDVIVVGVGAMGSAACAFLAERGASVLGLEQFEIVHDRGSHSGQSRIIRKAYFEHADYVPLLEKSYFNWRKLEEESEAKVYFETGIAYYGQDDGEIIPGITKAGLLYDINLEKLTHEQASSRFPAFRVPRNFRIVFEPEAGFLIPERAIKMFVAKANYHGAVMRQNESVQSWHQESSEIIVKTQSNLYRTKKLVFASGSWTGKLLPSLTEMLTVRRQVLAWIQPENERHFAARYFPCWFVEDPSLGLFYGFPRVDEHSGVDGPRGIKLAHHHPGTIADPDTIVDSGDEISHELHTVVERYIPSAGKNFTATKNCLYTYSPDADFIIDHLPGTDKQVVIACGFSGHGFKFASAVGEILADLALDGSTPLPIDFLRLDRLVGIQKKKE